MYPVRRGRRAQGRHELGVRDVHAVERTGDILGHQCIDDLGRIFCRRAIRDVDALRGELAAHVLEVANAFLPDDVHLDLRARLLELDDLRACRLDQVRVEPAREATVARTPSRSRT